MTLRDRVKQIEGEFRVAFSDRLGCGQPYGVYSGHKIVPSPHLHAVQTGQTWLVREILHWRAGSEREPTSKGKNHVQWGSVVYVWPIRRLD